MTPVTSVSSGVFSLSRENGVWWFVGPDGRRCWSLGVCCVNYGSAEEAFDPNNPSYCSARRGESEEEWSQRTLARLREWGFNSIAGWSDTRLFRKFGGDLRLPYFEVLHLCPKDSGQWRDLFDLAAMILIDAIADRRIPEVVDDPYLIGYFSDNELPWWGDTLFLEYFRLPAAAQGKAAWVKLADSHYDGDFGAFRRDWNTTASSFDGLFTAESLHIRPGGEGMAFVNAFLRIVADRYYFLVREAIRRHDPYRLFLGDRYVQAYSFDVVRASTPYLDCVSTNLGSDWRDGGNSRFYLETLAKLTDKPIVIGEFYAAAHENLSGCRNSAWWPDAFPTTETQVERAAACAANVRNLASNPNVVGAHWFQFSDEPPFGRGDGEDYNFGLVSIDDEPYELLGEVFRNANLASVHANGEPAHTRGALPQAPQTVMDGLGDWNREAGFVAPASGVPFADLYACRDEQNLYLGLYMIDFIDEDLYEGGTIPDGERPRWALSLNGRELVEVRFSGKGRPVSCEPEGIETSFLPGALCLRPTVILRVPLDVKGPGCVRLESCLQSHSRGEAMTWSADLVLPQQ